MSFLRSKVDQQQQEINKRSSKSNPNQSNLNRTLLDDDKALEIIELTLYKYQSFLDFLRNAGFGKLIEMGDMNQKQQLHNAASYTEDKLRQESKQQQQQRAKTSKRQTLSPTSSSKLSDQQKYYLEKINKTKSKISRNALESTKNSIIEPCGKYRDDIIDNSIINGQDGADSHQIDTLLSNALEISRSYRRMNSSSVNNSVLSQYHSINPSSKRNPNFNDSRILSEIEETNRENSNAADSSSHLQGFDQMHKSSQGLLVKGLKKGSMSSSTLINEASYIQKPSSKSKLKKLSKSPEFLNETEIAKPLSKSNLSNGSVGSGSGNGTRSGPAEPGEHS